MTRITSFEKSISGILKTDTKEITQFQLPTHKEPLGRKYESTCRDMYTRTLFKLFYNNEFLAYTKKALTKKQIQEALVLEHKTNRLLKRKLDRYLLTIGMFRQRYNDNILYAAQPIIYMLSFEYDKYGYIVVGGRYPTTYRYFEDCYNKCVKLKVADPRFVPPEAIEAIRVKQIQLDPEWMKWRVPDEKTIKELRSKLKLKELYNSVRFRPGFTREETPVNFQPIDE